MKTEDRGDTEVLGDEIQCQETPGHFRIRVWVRVRARVRVRVRVKYVKVRIENKSERVREAP